MIELSRFVNEVKRSNELLEFLNLDLSLLAYEGLMANYGYIPYKDYEDMPMPRIMGLLANVIKRNRQSSDMVGGGKMGIKQMN